MVPHVAAHAHSVFVVESFLDELAAAAKRDPVAYRRALLDNAPGARAVLDLAAEKAGGKPLPKGVDSGVSLQFVFGTYMAQVARVEVAKDGDVGSSGWCVLSIAAASSMPIPSRRRYKVR
jgi:isoquinoline 1-oxidoreductase beta subunit